MSPQNKQLRVVELLPGGEQITSRPLHVVAYMNDHGEAVVHPARRHSRMARRPARSRSPPSHSCRHPDRAGGRR